MNSSCDKRRKIERGVPRWAAGMEGEEGRSANRSAAAKKPRSKQLLCEQDPEAPGLTLEQRRKIRRRVYLTDLDQIC